MADLDQIQCEMDVIETRKAATLLLVRMLNEAEKDGCSLVYILNVMDRLAGDEGLHAVRIARAVRAYISGAADMSPEAPQGEGPA